MQSLADKRIDRAFFISLIVDMERLILDMMKWAGVTEKELCKCGEIETSFGETLSWEYLCYVRKHPIKLDIPTEILYGGNDSLTSLETVTGFAKRTGTGLTVMQSGEHWFHTEEQLDFLTKWLQVYADRRHNYNNVCSKSRKVRNSATSECFSAF